MRRKLAAGNWKMNGLLAALDEIDILVREIPEPECEIVMCPPATLLGRMSERTASSAVKTGGQDCHAEPGGAHTGDISARMLADAGAEFVIVGHSERRTDHRETDAEVSAKCLAALSAGLVPIVCLGETLEQRESGRTLEVVGAQLAGSLPDDVEIGRVVIAYEPVWAIGTGRVPTSEQIGEVHGDLRRNLTDRFGPAADAARILYGGSVKADNAAEIFAIADVDGALVGGASLKASDFSPIITALSR